MNRRQLLTRAALAAPAGPYLIRAAVNAPPPSGADDGPMVRELLAAGGEIRFGVGTYRLLSSGASYDTTAQRAPSVSIRGAGRYETTFDLQAPGYALYFRSMVPGRFQIGLTLEDIGIVTSGGSGYRSGLYLKGIYQAMLRNVRVEGMSGHGVAIDSPAGDADASVNVTLDNCWLWENGLYGLAAMSGPNSANISYLALRSCSIQGNQGAGVYWTGAVCSIRDTGIAANKGLGGLYVDFYGANSMNLEMASSTFENNTPRHMDVRSLIGGVFTNMDFRHTLPAAFPAADAVRLRAAPGALITRPVFTVPNLFAVPGYAPYTFFSGDVAARLIEPVWRQSPFPGQNKGLALET